VAGWHTAGGGGRLDTITAADPTIAIAGTATARTIGVGPTLVRTTGGIMTGDLEFAGGKGVIIRSPGGARFRVAVSDLGVLSVTAL
jgi:hypothetical protein